jgi:PAS domain S-box-containing protein
VKARRAKKSTGARAGSAAGLLQRLRKAERRLREVEDRYEIAMGAINESVYDWNISEDRVYFSGGMERVLALPPGFLKTSFKEWHERIHPEDFARYREATIAHLKGDSERFECDYRYRAGDGAWRWARTHGLAQRDARGRAVRMVGSTGDITELKRAEDALRKSEERYALATSAAVEGIYEWDVETGTLFLTERAKAFFSFPAEALTPAAWNARVHGEDYLGYRAAILDHFKGRTPHMEHEYRIADGRGGYKWVLDRGIGVRNAQGRVTKMVGALSDITQRKLAEIELRRARDQAEKALEQQTATADVLRVMAGSPADVQPVFDAIARKAVQLCDSVTCSLFRFDGRLQHSVAQHGLSADSMESLRLRYPQPPHPGTVTGRALLDRTVLHVEDISVDPRFPETAARCKDAWRRAAILAVPMLKEGEPIGVIFVARDEPRPFSDEQIALLQTFADQAVIAIENVRLFNETREALEQQTATAEILKVTSGSPTDVQPVFEAILTNASRLCEASFAAVFLYDGEVLHNVAQRNASREFAQVLQGMRARPSRETTTRRCALERRTIHTPDLLNDPEFSPPEPQRRENVRTALSVPMVRKGVLIGVITLWRAEVRPFTDKQVALVETFAAQAVIAIENVRLFNETREALERQTATGEVLAAVSNSAFNLDPVFDTIARNALRLANADSTTILRREDDAFVVAANAGTFADPELLKTRYQRLRNVPGRGTVTGRVALGRRTIQISDLFADPEYLDPQDEYAVSGGRSFLGVPILRGDAVVGVIIVRRAAVGGFDDKLIALLETFAAQASIAIENVRLFNETREALEQQKAAGEVLHVISSSIADTAPVFDKILDSCQRLFKGHLVGLTLAGKDGLVHLGAYKGENKEQMEAVYPYPLDRNSGSGQAILDRKVVHFADVGAPESDAPPHVVRGAQAVGFKSIIFAPLIAEGRAIGALWVGRRLPGPFGDKETALLKTFADQAVIAIQNVRLFNEIQEKSRQLEVASRHKSEFLANMSHELRTPLNAIIGFTRIVMRRSQESLEPKQYENLEKILASGEHLLALINSILDLSKVEAGRVEVHPGDVGLAPVLEQCVRTVEPLVNADAVTLVKEFGGELPRMYVDEEKLRQIVINLLSNAVKFTERGSVRLRAHAGNGSVAIAVTDTGIGIPPDKLEVIFEEFEQADVSSTRVHGGTGLGLTIARRLARLMGGDITAESALGSGSTFRLTLPLRYGAPK